MLSKNELDRRTGLEGVVLPQTLLNPGTATSGEGSNARRLRRQRRAAEGWRRSSTGWTVGMW